MNIMNVLLIQQDMGRRDIKYPLYPIGLSYIASAITNHSVRIFDPNCYDYPECFEELKKQAENFDPNVVGISIRNVDTTQRRDPFIHLNTVMPTIQAVKAVKPDVKVITGGTGFSIFAKEIMERFVQIDFGVYLEGEETFVELLENLESPEVVKGIFYRKNGKICFTGLRPVPVFENLPIPNRDPQVIDIKNYIGPFHNIIGIQGKRGCTFRCSYCSYPFLNERKIRLRDPGHIVDEIEYMINKFGVKGFTFVDSVFNYPEKHAEEICHEILRRNLDIEWGVWLTPKDLTIDFLLLLREAGCRHIGFSPDAITDDGLRTLNKSFSSKDIENSLKLARKVKRIAVGYNFFCAYPAMNLKDMLKTLLFIFKIPILLPGRGGVGLGWIRIEPHTDLYHDAIKEGEFPANTNLLPENEKELLNLFYSPPNQKFITFVFDTVLFMIENVFKPSAKSFFGFINKLRGRKSLYDS